MLEEDKKKIEDKDTDLSSSSQLPPSSSQHITSSQRKLGSQEPKEIPAFAGMTKEEVDIKKSDHKKSIYEELKEELHKVAEKLEETIDVIRPKRKQERELDKETGGTEIDYQQEKKQADEDKDIWDKDFKENPLETPAEIDGDSFETSANQSFIHSKKRGKGKKKGRLGPMTLNDQDTQNNDKLSKGKKSKETKMVDSYGHEVKKETMVEKISRFRTLNHENDQGGYNR